MFKKIIRPLTPGQRSLVRLGHDFEFIKPSKKLSEIRLSRAGRNNLGRITSRGRGGGNRRRFFHQDVVPDGVTATVEGFVYSACSSSCLVQLVSACGVRYISPAWEGAFVGAKVGFGSKAEVKPGNRAKLRDLPVGTQLFDVAIKVGSKGQLVRAAGSSATLAGKVLKDNFAFIRLPSGELRKVHLECEATVGVAYGSKHSISSLGKAGRSRWKGRRPLTRAVAKNPVDHPMGGGEGKSAGGRHPTSASGVLAKGLKTRSCKRTQKWIVSKSKR